MKSVSINKEEKIIFFLFFIYLDFVYLFKFWIVFCIRVFLFVLLSLFIFLVDKIFIFLIFLKVVKWDFFCLLFKLFIC